MPKQKFLNLPLQCFPDSLLAINYGKTVQSYVTIVNVKRFEQFWFSYLD